jgi:hypothetical protein
VEATAVAEQAPGIKRLFDKHDRSNAACGFEAVESLEAQTTSLSWATQKKETARRTLKDEA